MELVNILHEYMATLVKSHEIGMSKAESLFLRGGTFVLVLQPTTTICIPVDGDNAYQAIDRFIVSTSGIVNLGDLQAIKIFICINGNISQANKKAAFEFLHGVVYERINKVKVA